MNRGDVILVRFPHPSGVRGKKRPAVVVQSDAYTIKPSRPSLSRRSRRT
jgi:mRNA-degrading endonuclease toxin of MazEF toxin-antitoxin module